MCVECADRELLPSFHEVSVYPKKELPFFILFTAGLCSFTALLALLTHQYPDSMGVSQLKAFPFITYSTLQSVLWIRIRSRIWIKSFRSRIRAAHTRNEFETKLL